MLVNCGGGGKAILKPTGWVDGTLLTTEIEKESKSVTKTLFITFFNYWDVLYFKRSSKLTFIFFTIQVASEKFYLTYDLLLDMA